MGDDLNLLPTRKINDPARFGRVGLLVGGDSAEREVSLDGGRAVLAGLKRSRIETELFDGSTALFEAIN
jgi:D-alanine-D-alanine ligase